MNQPIYEIPVSGPGGEPYMPPPAAVPPVQDPAQAAPTMRPRSYSVAPPPYDAAPPQAYSAPLTFTAPPTVAAPQPSAPPRGYAAPAAFPIDDEELLDRMPPPVAPVPLSFDGEPVQASAPDADRDLLAALQEVLITGASDLHVSGNATPLIRVDGALRPIEGYGVWSRDRVSRALRSILSPQQEAAFEEHLELDLAYTVSANARFRVNIYQQRGSIGGAFRLIPTGIKELAELGMPEVVNRFATLARGLVLVTGPTGSGKSTTLAALVDLVNRTRADHIVTIEDPIEFLHTNKKSLVNQREVGSDTHSFANALKHVLRQDPDVILIGELRDLETISVALTAAETGHLVFATLHTQNASQTIDRVIDVFPPHQQGQVRAQLAATLQGVVCQTLLKRTSGRGRAVATEVMMATPAIANLIREGKTYQIPSAMQAGRELGMHTMDQHLAELVNSGTVTHAAALEKVVDPEGFKRLVLRPPSGADGFGFAADKSREGL